MEYPCQTCRTTAHHNIIIFSKPCTITTCCMDQITRTIQVWMPQRTETSIIISISLRVGTRNKIIFSRHITTASRCIGHRVPSHQWHPQQWTLLWFRHQMPMVIVPSKTLSLTRNRKTWCCNRSLHRIAKLSKANNQISSNHSNYTSSNSKTASWSRS